MKISTYQVTDDLVGERLDVAVTKLAPELTRARIQKLIAAGLILVNNAARKANYRLRGAEVITVSIPEAKPSPLQAQSIPLEILYEMFEAVNKPKGMVVHPAAGHAEGTGERAALSPQDLSGIGGGNQTGHCAPFR